MEGAGGGLLERSGGGSGSEQCSMVVDRRAREGRGAVVMWRRWTRGGRGPGRFARSGTYCDIHQGNEKAVMTTMSSCHVIAGGKLTISMLRAQE